MRKVWSKLVSGRCRHRQALTVTSVGIRRMVCESCGHISFEVLSTRPQHTGVPLQRAAGL